MTSTPMQTMQLCEFAGEQANKLDNVWIDVKTICVRGEQ